MNTTPPVPPVHLSLIVKLSISIGITVPLAVTAYLLSPLQLLTVPNDRSVTYCAPRGDHITVPLSDGSTAELNTGSCVTVNYSAKQRLVDLMGEAEFTVAHDPRRPFIVEVGRVRAQALGTRYNVHKRQHDTRVSVLDGTVQVSAPGVATQSLAAMHEIDVPDEITEASALRRITQEEIDQRTAWLAGQLVFANQPILETLAEFSRYRDLTVESPDPRISNLQLSGSFKTNELTGYLKLLPGKCIRVDYNESGQLVKLSAIPGKQPGERC